MTTQNVQSQYSGYFKTWSKDQGAKPTSKELTLAHELGARQGSKVALALAMYARSTGATQNQVSKSCGGPQLNKLRALVAGDQVERVPMPNTDKGHVVYRMALKAGKATKPKATTKAKPKAKAIKVTGAKGDAKAAAAALTT